MFGAILPETGGVIAGPGKLMHKAVPAENRPVHIIITKIRKMTKPPLKKMSRRHLPNLVVVRHQLRKTGNELLLKIGHDDGNMPPPGCFQDFLFPQNNAVRFGKSFQGSHISARFGSQIKLGSTFDNP